jgi:signal transduction histidine kinase
MRGFLSIFLFAFAAFLPQNAFAQVKPDSIAVSNLVATSYKMFLTNPDSSIALANKALALAVQGKYPNLEGHSLYILSKANWAKANFRLSTEYGFKALKILEKFRHIHLWGETLLSLARTFTDLRNFDQANSYIHHAKALAVQNADTLLLADVFREHSMLLLETQQYDSALFYSDKGLALYENFKDTLNASILYSRKAKVFFATKKYSRSMAFNRKALMLDSLVKNRRAQGVSYLLAAQNAYYLHHNDSAIFFLKKAIPVSNEIANHATLVRVHDLLAEIYFKTGQATLAVEHLRLVSRYKDSLYNTQKGAQIQEMQTLYELETKDKTIKMLEQENALHQQQMRHQRLWMAFLALGIILLAALILVLTRLRKIETKTNEALSIKNVAIEQQKEEIHAQAENLLQLNQLKSKLFSVISHDLRGPIATLHSLLELLTNKRMTPEEFLVISDKLKANLNVTQRTLENLLNWSLSQMEGIKTEKKDFLLHGVVDESCRLMEEIASKKNVSLESNVHPSLRVVADPDQVQLILRNLIHNAIKFSKRNGRVLVSCEEEQDTCKVTVRDYGIGMTPDEVGNIIGSKKHFTKIGTQQEKGTGLGLLLCQEFIKRNGGDLKIQSIAGEGTAVSFTLLIAASQERAAS